jgi:hypothetical protein
MNVSVSHISWYDHRLTITKNKELLPLADCNLSKKRKEIVRNTLRVFAHNSTRVTASRVEVSQESSVVLVAAHASLLGRVALRVDMVGDHGLDAKLRVAVRVGRTERALLGDGNHVGEACGVAVDGRGGREDDVGHVVFLHAAQQAEGAKDVDAVVLERDLAGLANSLVSLSACLFVWSFF